MTTHRRTALAALASALPATGQPIQLLPAGAFRSTDGSGRPVDTPHWQLDAAGAARLIGRVAAKANPLVIDYEHQTLNAEKNGRPAPAAGWLARDALEWRDGAGLFARPEWTPSAAKMIADGEYRYVSPVFEYDRTSGEVLDLRMAALTNNPGLSGMAAVALTALNDFSTDEDDMNETLKKLLAALGLAETAGEDEALAGVAALKAKAEAVDGLNAQVAALTAQAPDPARFVPVETMQGLQTQVAALTAEITAGKVGKAIDDALAAGKLLPVQRGWAEALGRTDYAALVGYIENTPAIAALNGTQTGGAAAGSQSHQPTDADLAVMKALGLTAEQFAAGKLEV